MKKKVLITSALPYVNNIPHLGNLIGSTLSADVYARHKRLQGHDVLYVCGADEHGTTTEIKAREEGLSPQALCDKYGKIHKTLYDWFHISFDVWGRTHTSTHEAIVQEIYEALHKEGYVIQKEVAQLYDEKAQQYLADRFVEGECPHCGAQGARGDQCDACQQLITATDLKNPVSKLTGTKPIIKNTTHLFLDLPALTPLVQEWLSPRTHTWSVNAAAITKQWMQELKPRAITRDLEWGVPVPGMPGKVFYVWFDAPIGYISITAHARDDWKEWWNNTEVELIQFMGKDNVVFHSVLFPATLLGTGQHWNTADTIAATEFLNLERGKFSKSRKTGVFAEDCLRYEKDIPADVWRYYLLSVRPETADTTFSFKDLQARTNNELIANLANLVHRTAHFAHTKLAKEKGELTPAQEAFIRETREQYKAIHEQLDKQHLRGALQEIFKVAKNANAHFQHQEPWKTLAEQPEQAAADIRALLTIVRDLSILISPYMPQAATKIQTLLGEQELSYADLQGVWDNSFTTINQPETLFKKMEDDLREQLEKEFLPQTHALDLRVAEITSAKEHPNADKLLVLQLTIGDEKRQLVAGLKGHYTPEELEGKKIIIVYNLAPAKLRGEISQGMLLASEDKQGTVGLLVPDAPSGTRLTIGEQTGQEDPIAFEEFLKYTIVSTEKDVTVNGEALAGAAITVDKNAHGKVR